MFNNILHFRWAYLEDQSPNIIVLTISVWFSLASTQNHQHLERQLKHNSVRNDTI